MVFYFYIYGALGRPSFVDICSYMNPLLYIHMHGATGGMFFLSVFLLVPLNPTLDLILPFVSIAQLDQEMLDH